MRFWTAVALIATLLVIVSAQDYEEDISIGGYHPEGRPTIILSPGTGGPLEVTVGEDLYSRCSVRDNDEYSYRWVSHLPDQTLLELSNNAVLMMSQVSYEDIQHPISCEVTRQFDGAKFDEMLNFRVDTQYKVTIRPLSQEVIVGRPYEMVCEVSPPAERPVNYRWYHNDQIVGQDAQLRVASLSYPDIGNYVCRAEWTPMNSRAGPISANATVELTLALTRDVEIEMSAPPGSIMVTLPGEMRELHCEYSSRNPQDVRWFFEGQPLEFHPSLNSSGRVHRIDRMLVSIVTLRAVELAHAGTYECRVNNDVKQSHVIVKYERGLEINPQSDTVDEGTAVEFHCRAHGAERQVNREMQWFFRPFYGGSMVPLDLNRQGGFQRQDDPYASHTSFISKISVAKSDEGEYICRLPSQNSEAVGKLYVRAAARHRVIITPPVVKVRMNQPIELECYVTDESGRAVQVTPSFRLRDTRVRFESDRIGENRARFRVPNGLESQYNGTQVECHTDSGMSATAIIIIEATCQQGYRRCRSGQCLPFGRFCDGVFDCADRSDEDPIFCAVCDPIAKECKHVQNRPAIKKNYMIHWECDGEDDCGNGYDESRCPDSSVARCDGSMFQCQSSQRSIPLAYVCDKDQDCVYGEDERNCAAPVIQSSGMYRHPVRVGGQVVLTCRVTGQPIPRVIWRFNWGCLPDEGNRFRLHSTVENCHTPMPTVVSTLTITNVQHGDDGIYNCEALSGATRAMSNDYFVTLE